MRKTILQLAVFALALSLLVLFSTMLAFYVSWSLSDQFLMLEARFSEDVFFTLIPALLALVHFSLVFHVVKLLKRRNLIVMLDAAVIAVLSIPLEEFVFYCTDLYLYSFHIARSFCMIGLIGIAMAVIFKIFVPKTEE